MRKVLAGVALLMTSMALLLLPQFTASRAQQAPAAKAPVDAEPVPAYHPEPPKGQLPDTMDASLYTDKVVFNAYTVAGRVKKVLYQQPCYCHCDRSQGHGSLLDCFAGRHGAGCDVCQKEAFYSYEQTHKGKTPAQIRAGIMRGEWQKVNLAKYQGAYLPPL